MSLGIKAEARENMGTYPADFSSKAMCQKLLLLIAAGQQLLFLCTSNKPEGKALSEGLGCRW